MHINRKIRSFSTPSSEILALHRSVVQYPFQLLVLSQSNCSLLHMILLVGLETLKLIPFLWARNCCRSFQITRPIGSVCFYISWLYRNTLFSSSYPDLFLLRMFVAVLIHMLPLPFGEHLKVCVCVGGGRDPRGVFLISPLVESPFPKENGLRLLTWISLLVVFLVTPVTWQHLHNIDHSLQLPFWYSHLLRVGSTSWCSWLKKLFSKADLH